MMPVTPMGTSCTDKNVKDKDASYRDVVRHHTFDVKKKRAIVDFYMDIKNDKERGKIITVIPSQCGQLLPNSVAQTNMAAQADIVIIFTKSKFVLC